MDADAMQTHPKNRIDIVIEQAAVPRLTAILDDADGVSGYVVVSVHGGKGDHGTWSRNGLVSEADGMMLITCVVDPQYKDAILDRVFPFIEQRSGIVTISPCEVIRDERF